MSRKIFWFLFACILVVACWFRLYRLGSIPVALSQAEVSVMVAARSLNETAGVTIAQPQPVSVWITALSFTLWGHHSWSLRLPSALIGLGLVLTSGWLAKRLFKDPANKDIRTPQILQLMTMLAIAVSPWPIMASRTAQPVQLGLLLLVSTLVCLSFRRQHSGWLLSLVLIPLLGYEIWVSSLFNFQVKDLFVNQNYSELSVTYQELVGDTWFDRFIFQPQFLMFPEFTENLADTFSLDFLFITGDQNLLQGTGSHGLFLLIFLPFLGIGIYQLWDTHRHLFLPLMLWLMLAALPATFTQVTPDSFRFSYAVVPLALTMSVGLTVGVRKVTKLMPLLSIPILAGMTLALFLSIFQFWHYYLTFYPTLSNDAWSNGFKEAAFLYTARIDEVDAFYWELGEREFPLWLQAYGDLSIQNTVQFQKYQAETFRGFEYTSPGVTKVLIAARPEKLPELQVQQLTVIKNIHYLGNNNIMLVEVERK